MRWIMLATTILVVGCSTTITRQPADPVKVARIMSICEASGLFKLVDGAIVLAVPAASLPVAIVNAGVDKVCMDPEKFASDISTAKWLIRNFSGLKD